MLWKQTSLSVTTFVDAICTGSDLSVVNWLLFLRSLISRLWRAAVAQQQGISNHRLVDIVTQPGNL